jgi:phosphoglycolate phosphatase-like HAD superfamily hydrolase
VVALFWDLDGTLLTTARAGVFSLEDALEQVTGVRAEDFYACQLEFLQRLGLVGVFGRKLSCTLLGMAFNNDVATVLGTDATRQVRHPQGVDLMQVGA